VLKKQEYLTALSNSLKAKRVRDSVNILKECQEFLDSKIEYGYSEEEATAMLWPPDDVAASVKSDESQRRRRSDSKTIRAVSKSGLIIADLFIIPLCIAMFALILLYGVITMGGFFTGVFLIAGLATDDQGTAFMQIPSMPYICAVFLGIAVVSLSVTSCIGVEYCRLQATQILRKLARLHKYVLTTAGYELPPLPFTPWISSAKRRFMRTIAFVSFILFAFAIIICLVSMVFISRSLTPWNVWNWFS